MRKNLKLCILQYEFYVHDANSSSSFIFLPTIFLYALFNEIQKLDEMKVRQNLNENFKELLVSLRVDVTGKEQYFIS